jgi:hypothetical protein
MARSQTIIARRRIRLGDHTFEIEIFERMTLGAHGQAFFAGNGLGPSSPPSIACRRVRVSDRNERAAHRFCTTKRQPFFVRFGFGSAVRVKSRFSTRIP